MSSKMKIELFETIKINLANCHILPNQKRLIDGERLFALFVAFLIVLEVVLFLVVDANSVIEIVLSAYLCITVIFTFVCFSSFVFKSEEIFSLIDTNLTETVKKRLECQASGPMYIKTHRLVEKSSKILTFVVVDLTSVCLLLPKAAVSFYLYYSTDSGAEAFDLPIPFWFPFDWHNPTGYVLALVIELISVMLTMRFFACSTTLGIGVFLFALSFAKDLISQLQSINKCAHAKESETNLLKRLSELMNLQADVYEWYQKFNDVFEISLAACFTCSILTICLSMLFVQVEIMIGDIDTVELLESVILGFWALALLVFATELGQIFSDRFAAFDDKVNKLDWYLLPMKIQRMLPIIMINTQQTIYVACFGGTTCSRETLKKIVNTAYSYFMVLRKFFH